MKGTEFFGVQEDGGEISKELSCRGADRDPVASNPLGAHVVAPTCLKLKSMGGPDHHIPKGNEDASYIIKTRIIRRKRYSPSASATCPRPGPYGSAAQRRALLDKLLDVVGQGYQANSLFSMQLA